MRAMQRVPPADFEPALKKRLEELWGTPPNLYRALANHPPIIAAWTEFANTLRHGARTPRALRELVILRTAQLSRSDYEWAHHVRMAAKAGVREAQLAALGAWRSSGQFDAREKAALALADAVTEGRLGDELYREAMQHFDAQEFVELTVIGAFYAMVARVLDALGVELEPDLKQGQTPFPLK
jgi:AhpD family alkylhydroperoxidase